MEKSREEIMASYPQSLIEKIKDGGDIQLRTWGTEKAITVCGATPEGIAKTLGDDGNYHQDREMVEAAARSLDEAVESGELACHQMPRGPGDGLLLCYRLP